MQSKLGSARALACPDWRPRQSAGRTNGSLIGECSERTNKLRTGRSPEPANAPALDYRLHVYSLRRAGAHGALRQRRVRVNLPRMNAHAIVAGGGWRKAQQQRVKIKAACCAILFFPAMALSITTYERTGIWIFAFPSVLLIGSIIGFIFERATVLPEGPGVGCDPRKLYSHPGSTAQHLRSETNSKSPPTK